MKILKDSAIYLTGELINKALPFMLLPYLTRKLGADGFGELSFYLTLLTLISIVLGFSQDGAVARYYYFYGARSLPLLVKTGYAYTLLMTLCGFIVCWLSRNEILTYLVIIAALTSFLNVQLSVRQCQKQPLPYVLIQLLNSVAMAILTVVFLEFLPGNQVVNRLLAVLVGNALVLAITLRYINQGLHSPKRFSHQAHKAAAMYLFAFGLPLIFHQLSFFIKGQLDRVFIYQSHSTTQLGVYAAGAQLASVLPILLMALNKALVPYYYASLKAGRLSIVTLRHWALISTLLCFIPALMCWLLPNELFGWLLGDHFAASQYFASVFLLGYGLTLPYLVLVNFFFYHGRNQLIAATTLISAALYLILLQYFNRISLTLVPYALVLSNLLTVVMLWTLSLRKKS